MDYIAQLCNMTNQGRKGGRDFILDYLSKNGNLHDKLKVIHVAGTAGKGSTSAMIANGLQKSGKKVGLFTSPHLLKLNERIQINGESISDEDLNCLIEKYMDLLSDLSFSEYLTLIMIDYFVENEIDYLVCECFVGGRYDPTNIFDSIATVLTSVGLDHVGLIGNNVDEILMDKLGILRKDVPLFTRIDNEIVRGEVEEIGAKLSIVSKLCDTNMKGDFQRENAGIAFEVLDSLGIEKEVIEASLQEVEWHGRCEFVEKNILVDCAHNSLGTEALIKYVDSINAKKKYCLFAKSNNKEFSDFEEYLKGFDEIVFTKPDVFKITDPNEYGNGKIIEDVKGAFDYIKDKLEDEDLLVVCGSVFLAAEILGFYEY